MKTKVFLNNEHLYICTFYYSHNMKYPPSIYPHPPLSVFDLLPSYNYLLAVLVSLAAVR